MKKHISRSIKSICFALSVLMVFTAFAGCSKKQTTTTTSSGKSTITEWVWGNYEELGAADFSKYYPNIKVNYVMVASADYLKKLQTTSASGGLMPDVANLEMTPRGTEVNMGSWERLDAAPYNLNKSDLVPWALPLISDSKGEVVCSQIDNCVGGYAYNRPLADKYLGSDDPNVLQTQFPTIDSFVQKGLQVKAASNGKVFMFAGAGDLYTCIEGLYTKDPWVKDGKLNLDSTFVPTYTAIAQMVKDGTIGKYVMWTPAMNTEYSSNTVIFFPGPSWYLTFEIKANDKNAKGKYGLLTPPGGGFEDGGTAYAISKTSKNKMAAWTYIKWFTMSQEGTNCFVKAESTPTLYAPSYTTDIYTSDANNDPFFGGQNVLAKLIDIAKNPNTSVRPMTEYDASISDANTTVLNDLSNGMDATTALKELKSLVIKSNPGLTE